MFFPALRCFVSLGMSVWWLRTCWRSPAPTADPSVGHAGGSCRQSRAVPGRLLTHEEQRLPFRGEMQCGLKYTLLRDNRQTFLVARINFASYFQRRLSITNSEALSFNQKKERKRNWH